MSKKEPPWKEVEAYLRENGVTYPWQPRDTYKALKQRDAWKEAAVCLEDMQAMQSDYADDLMTKARELDDE